MGFFSVKKKKKILGNNSNRDCKYKTDFRHITEVEKTEFNNGLETKWMKEKEIKDDAEVELRQRL